MPEDGEKKAGSSHSTDPATRPTPAPAPAPAPPTNGENTSSPGKFGKILEPSEKKIGFP